MPFVVGAGCSFRCGVRIGASSAALRHNLYFAKPS
jgi:hypothetical protein